jgi:predicted amidohydrolase YtcJ
MMPKMDGRKCWLIWRATAWLSLAATLVAAGLQAQPPDTVLINGKVLTGDAAFTIVQALAVTDGRVAAVGTSAEMRKLAGGKTRVIDLGGRTVIPGLIDSHLHGIRAATSFSTEVNWIGAKSIGEAMGRLTAAAKAKRPGEWLIVAGGWDERQFAERRRPRQAELEAAAQGHPAYVQLGYGWVLLNAAGLDALKIKSAADLPAGAQFANGEVSGGQNAIVALFDKLPTPTYEQKVAGTLAFFRELNRLGLTGFVDPGGNNLFPADYAALQQVWRDKQMTVRIAFALNGQTPGKEFDELKQLTVMSPMGFGDEMLHFNGLGERITWEMNNNTQPTEEQKKRYFDILLFAAQRGLAITMHCDADATANMLMDIFERVNREAPIGKLRWSFAHLGDGTRATFERMKAMGVGWTVQDALYFGGDQLLARSGPEAARHSPPVMAALEVGVRVGAGTDAHRVASYNPFTALQWLLDGKTVSGAATRGPEETPNREQALRLYTQGSAWFSFDEARRGSIEAGKFADLAVLDRDYLTVPVAEIGNLESLLTMVAGRVVYGAGPLKRWEQ